MTAEVSPIPYRKTFFEALEEQRWDDHRYYHHSRINQSLHFFSALCFLTAYVTIWFDPVATAMLGWFGAMVSRQIGHFFFEPKTYDNVNHATHSHKESIKVGYNLRRKVVLLSFWAAITVVLWFDPSAFGTLSPHADFDGYLYRVSVAWLIVGGVALVVRTGWLCYRFGAQTGLVWLTKIITDPLHDARIYWRSPFFVLRGELLDPMTEWKDRAVTNS
jgi:hypothetical protein